MHRSEDLVLARLCCSSNRNTGDPNGVRITEGDPVVSVSALLQLVERLHQFRASNQGRQLCESMKTDVPPLRGHGISLNRLWETLSEQTRQQTLATLSQIIVQQLQLPQDQEEVENEDR